MLTFPLVSLGEYTIDPNEGCSSDAVEVYCDFEKQATCVDPKKTRVRVNKSRNHFSGVAASANLLLYAIVKSFYCFKG